MIAQSNQHIQHAKSLRLKALFNHVIYLRQTTLLCATMPMMLGQRVDSRRGNGAGSPEIVLNMEKRIFTLTLTPQWDSNRQRRIYIFKRTV